MGDDRTAPVAGKRNLVLGFLLGVLATVVVGAGAFLVLRDSDSKPAVAGLTNDDDATPEVPVAVDPEWYDLEEPLEGGPPDEPPTGDERWDDRARRCHEGDMSGCDVLRLLIGDPNSVDDDNETLGRYRQYGVTCGGRFDVEVWPLCEDRVPDPELP